MICFWKFVNDMWASLALFIENLTFFEFEISKTLLFALCNSLSVIDNVYNVLDTVPTIFSLVNYYLVKSLSNLQGRSLNPDHAASF